MPDKQKKKIIDIDASSWKTSHDLYDAILPRLGAPSWHGASVNALTESMVLGEINAVEAPYALRIHGTANLAPELTEELGWLEEGVVDARADIKSREGHDVDVEIEILP